MKDTSLGVIGVFRVYMGFGGFLKTQCQILRRISIRNFLGPRLPNPTVNLYRPKTLHSQP